MIYGWAALRAFPFAKNIAQTERNTRQDHNTVKYCRLYEETRVSGRQTAYYTFLCVSIRYGQTHTLPEFTS